MLRALLKWINQTTPPAVIGMQGRLLRKFLHPHVGSQYLHGFQGDISSKNIVPGGKTLSDAEKRVEVDRALHACF